MPARNFSLGAASSCLTTVILFWVRVPVLSEQMVCVQPRVSTAESLRIIAWRLAILVTPSESTMVTTATRPSGMAATASETATIKVSSRAVGSVRTLPTPWRMISTPKITTQMTITMMVRMRLSSASFTCSGVSSSLASARAPAILPISVFMPVPTTTARPRPYTTVEPM